MVETFESRVRLARFTFYLFPGSFGVLGLVDHGRVFTDDDLNRSFFRGLHRGVGGFPRGPWRTDHFRNSPGNEKILW